MLGGTLCFSRCDSIMSKQSLYFLLKLIHFHTNEGKCSLNIEYQVTNKSNGDELLKKRQFSPNFSFLGNLITVLRF